MKRKVSYYSHVLSLFNGLLLIVKTAKGEKDLEHFENKIRPILVKHCYRCHSAKKGRVKGGLLLDTRAGKNVCQWHSMSLGETIH